MRLSLALPLCLLAALPLTATAQTTTDTTAATEAPATPVFDPATVLARVNGSEITLGHVAQIFAQLPANIRQMPDDRLFEGILEQLVDQQLLSDQQTGPVPATIERALENERRGLLARRSINALVTPPVSDAEYQAAYDAEFADAAPTKEFNAAHILVETEEEAAALVEELASGADFAELAEAHSTGPSGPNGGALGWFGPGAMVPAFEEAVVALEPETVSAPVQTRFGWHVIRLNEVRETPVPTLDEVRDTLTQGILEARVAAEVETLREAAEVEVLATEIPPSAIRDRTLLED